MCKEDLFGLLLSCRQLHCWADVATVKVAVELYLMLHELIHLHEGGLLGGAKPTNQLVANISEPGNCLKVIPDALVKFGLCTICLSGALLSNDVGLFSEIYILETLTHQVEQCWTVIFFASGS
jgi:hypothetical protein